MSGCWPWMCELCSIGIFGSLCVFFLVKMHPLIPGSFEFAQTMADGGVFTNSGIKV